MLENYFKNHSDEELANLALEYNKFQRTKKGNPSPTKYDKDNQFYQEIQIEIVQRFVDQHRKK